MANLKPVYATEATLLSTELNTLAAGGAVSSAEQNNSTNRYLDAIISVELALVGAGTGFSAVYLQEGVATGKLDTTDNLTNMRKIRDVQHNGATAVRKSMLVKDIPKFYTVRIINNEATQTYAATGNTVKFTGLNYENA